MMFIVTSEIQFDFGPLNKKNKTHTQPIMNNRTDADMIIGASKVKLLRILQLDFAELAIRLY